MQLLSAKTNESIWCQSDKQTDAVCMQRISYCILIIFNTSSALSIEMSLVLSLVIQRSTLQHFIWYGLSSTLPEYAACFYGTASKSYKMLLSWSPHNRINVYSHKDIGPEVFKAAVVPHSDVFGAVLLSCSQPVLSFYMLCISYSNLNKHKSWLAINNPVVISWTRYLVRSN